MTLKSLNFFQSDKRKCVIFLGTQNDPPVVFVTVEKSVWDKKQVFLGTAEHKFSACFQ